MPEVWQMLQIQRVSPFSPAGKPRHMSLYPFDSIDINGRTVRIDDIRRGNTSPKGTFETSLFAFITEWLGGVDRFIQHTSGSTGTPKPITISRSQMIASAEMTKEALDLRQGDTALVCLNPEFIAGKMMLVRSFVTGMKIVAVEPAANPFVTLPPDQPVDFAAIVPYQLVEILASEKSVYFNRLKKIIIGGGGVDEKTIDRIQAYRCEFYLTYGMTETISHIALRHLNGDQKSPDFTVLNGITISQDLRGCLVVQWDQLETAIVTNDIVDIRGERRFRWIGRWDNVINTGGIKVIPEKLELIVAGLFSELGIDQRFFIDSVPDEKLGQMIVLITEGVLESGVRQRLKERMKETIPRYELPREVLSGKKFVFTATGKIDRSASRSGHLASPMP